MCVVFKLNAQFAHTTQELAGFRIGFFLQQKWQQKRGVGEEKEEELEDNSKYGSLVDREIENFPDTALVKILLK